MNAERLLRHFETISETPDAVARLRRFILDLAVRGKLVEQDPEDEPVEDLLQRIAVEKTSRRSARARSTPDERVEGWCSIPASWNFVRLDKVCTVIMGSSPPGSTYNKTGDGVPLINGPVEFTPGPFGRTRINQYTTDPSAFCEEDDFLVCVRGSTTGRTNIAAFRACIGRGVAAIQPMFEDKFIRLAIRVRQEAILQMGRGIAFPSISREQLSGLPVPLPPLAQQHRIVAKVDELMALCDQLEAARYQREQGRERLVAATLHRLNQPAANHASFRQDASFALQVLPSLTTTPAQIKQLRQTILNLAVRGKLVEQDPEDEPAISWLLQRVEGNYSRRIRKTVATRDEGCQDSSISILPETWLWVVLDDLVLVMDSGWSPQCEDHARSSIESWGVLKTTAVQSLFFDERHHKELPSNLQPRPQHEAREGDILITRAGPKNRVGISCVIDKIEPLLMISDKIIRLRLADGLSPCFVALALNAGRSSEAVEDAKSGMAVMQMNISQVKLRAVPIPLPPLAEQHRIVAKVDELMALCDQLEQQISQADQQRRRLLEAVLAEALEEPEQALAAMT